MMRVRAGIDGGCPVGWAIAFGATGTFLLLAIGFGFFSLILVGLVFADACLSSELTLDDPLARRRADGIYGLERLAREHQAGRAAARRADTRCLRVGRWCGLGVLALGLAGFWWSL